MKLIQIFRHFVLEVFRYIVIPCLFLLAIVILLVITGRCAHAQTTVIFTWTIQATLTDTAVPINVTQDAGIAAANYLFKNTASGVSSGITLTGNVTNSTTVLPLSNTTGIIPGMGICISPSSTNGCTLSMSTGLVVSGGELARVLSVNGLNVTVARGQIGTAASYTTGQVVSILRSGSYSDLAANLLRDFYASVIINPIYGSLSVQQMLAAQALLQSNAQIPH